MSRNVDVIRAHYAGSERKDLAAMLAPLTMTTVWIEMDGSSGAGPYLGTEAIANGVFRRIGEEWDGFTFTLEKLIDGGETIVGIGTYAGVYKKTGKPMSARVVHVWDMDDGKVARFEQFTDTKRIAEATF